MKIVWRFRNKNIKRNKKTKLRGKNFNGVQNFLGT